MSRDIHTIAVVDGTIMQKQDRIVFGVQPQVANVAGAGAGAAVTTTVTFSKGLPLKYSVQITPNQDAVAYVTNRTVSGFDVVLNPRLAANTLAIGTFDVTVLG